MNIDEVIHYAQTINSRTEVLRWLQTTGKKSIKTQKVTASELEHVVDFMNSDAAPKRLLKMSIKDAKRKANKWQEANRKKGRNLVDTEDDIETFLTFEDGSKIVKLKSKAAFQREGHLMSHCLGGYSPDTSDMYIYSYRDVYNNPHATFEVRKDCNEVVQIKGKGNGPIHPKYINPVLKFLEELGIDIRHSDMQNLGYYHITKEQLGLLELYEGATKQIAIVNGEYYAHG